MEIINVLMNLVGKSKLFYLNCVVILSWLVLDDYLIDTACLIISGCLFPIFLVIGMIKLLYFILNKQRTMINFLQFIVLCLNLGVCWLFLVCFFQDLKLLEDNEFHILSFINCNQKNKQALCVSNLGRFIDVDDLSERNIILTVKNRTSMRIFYFHNSDSKVGLYLSGTKYLHFKEDDPMNK